MLIGKEWGSLRLSRKRWRLLALLSTEIHLLSDKNSRLLLSKLKLSFFQDQVIFKETQSCLFIRKVQLQSSKLCLKSLLSWQSLMVSLLGLLKTSKFSLIQALTKMKIILL